jgi:hypothetical protein
MLVKDSFYVETDPEDAAFPATAAGGRIVHLRSGRLEDLADCIFPTIYVLAADDENVAAEPDATAPNLMTDLIPSTPAHRFYRARLTFIANV